MTVREEDDESLYCTCLFRVSNAGSRRFSVILESIIEEMLESFISRQRLWGKLHLRVHECCADSAYSRLFRKSDKSLNVAERTPPN